MSDADFCSQSIKGPSMNNNPCKGMIVKIYLFSGIGSYYYFKNRVYYIRPNRQFENLFTRNGDV